ncbi:fibrinogen-like protein A, partial [Saccostrea cucullata]|uniref:fibrinogen-like protein A n=1 Tax=Saccostrea cuccullata TaxID=36930 RepID=UPI002ED216F8
MAMDICDVTVYPRCRLWTTLPDVSSTNTYICRRFFEITTKFLQVTTPQTSSEPVSIQTTSNSIPQTTSDLSSQTTTLLTFQAQTALESAIQTTASADTTTAIATTPIDMNCAEGCDCLPITNKFGPESEQYPVTLDGNNVSYVCKLISGEVWTVIQRRINGVIDFHSKLWTEYEAGFGSNSNEFWIGLKEIHRLTSVGLTKIRINLGFEDGSDGYAQYSHFTVGGTDTDYMLTISGYSGTA